MGIVINWSTGYNGSAASVDDRVADMPTLGDGVHDVMASHVNTLADAVIELQTNQAGLLTTVALHTAQIAALVGATDHGTLTGLADDDHVQYLLIDGTRAMTGALQLTDGALGAPGAAFASELDTGIYRPAADQLGIVASGVAVALFQAPSGANPQLLVADGLITAPSLAFASDTNTGIRRTASDAFSLVTGGADRLAISSTAITAAHPVLATGGSATAPGVAFSAEPNTGFYRSGAGAIDLAITGSQRFQFTINELRCYQSTVIRVVNSNSDLSFVTNRTTATTPSFNFQNQNAFSGGAGADQGGVGLAFTINQTSTASFSGLKINLTNTALGSGAQHFLNLQVAGTTVAGITNGSTAATQGRFLSGDGAAATPSLGFLADATAGFYRPALGVLGVVAGGAERWRFTSGNFQASVNGAIINQGVANGGLNIQSNLTTSTDDRYGIRVQNASYPSISTGSLRLMEVRFPVNMSGTAGYTVLDVIASETATGSGSKWLLSAKAGAGGTTRYFGVDNVGHVTFASTRKLQDYTTRPEGLVTAPVGSIAVVEDTTLPANNGIWAKYEGSGTSGWDKLNHHNTREVYGFEDFDGTASNWSFDIGTNASAYQVANGASFGFPGSGCAVLQTVAGSSNGTNALRPLAGMVLDTDAEIVTEWKFLPFSPTETAATAPGATSVLTGSSAVGDRAVQGVPALTGEGDAPFWVVLDNGVDPAETRRVRLRAGTTLYIDGTLNYAYAPGDTAAYAGPADQALVYANDEFTWLVGLGGGNENMSPLVTFGGLWDNGSSTMTNAIIMFIDGAVVTETFVMPALTAAYYRARLTVSQSQVVLEMADGEGAYSVVATYSGTVDPVVYFPYFAALDGFDTRGIVVDWVKWHGYRPADGVVGASQGTVMPSAGQYVPTFTTTGGGTTPSMVGSVWTWTRVDKVFTVSGRFSSVDDAGVATGDLYFSLPFETRGSSSAIGSAVGRDSSGNPYVCLVTSDGSSGTRARVENFTYDGTAAIEWWITYTYTYRS